MSRDAVILGALAGFVATLPMTATMSRLHQTLSLEERYPLPPRELAEDMPSMAVGRATATLTLVYHFLYGAAAGALFGGITDAGISRQARHSESPCGSPATSVGFPPHGVSGSQRDILPVATV
ncbi:hypothetical protein ASE63_25065 [Bosea sp. Root381]|uniref:hypothetical protein n=1 Tax=Bosea sp. Root381 TaxID=1736524 RepID=UPI0006F65624|nr:hypothetical protein [Bosea sp. Root381]KRE05036.1 hypothetical protein ASE63_25065 [Bosea sp. Root381]